jgi:cellulase/cellobiase CelA1
VPRHALARVLPVALSLCLGAVTVVHPPSAAAATASGPSTANDSLSRCTATVRVVHAWTGGYTLLFTVRDTMSGPPEERWDLDWQFPTTHTITNVWDAALTSEGTALHARPLAWNMRLTPGEDVQFGLQIAGMATFTPPTVRCTSTAWEGFRANGTGNLATPTAPTTVSTLPSAGTCTATVRIDNAAAGGFDATVTVSNAGTATLRSWSVVWGWQGGQQVSDSWDATVRQRRYDVTVDNADWNGEIPPAGSTTVGMHVYGRVGQPTPACTGIVSRH